MAVNSGTHPPKVQIQATTGVQVIAVQQVDQELPLPAKDKIVPAGNVQVDIPLIPGA